jgi:REP-associated tyrosine transposase
MLRRGAKNRGQTPGHVAKGERLRADFLASPADPPPRRHGGRMPRGRRQFEIGGIYHVTARGNRRQRVFTDDVDFSRYLEVLRRAVRESTWRLRAYCLMPNHLHLVVELEALTLSTGMQLLGGIYAQWFNRRHGYDGHLFQGRFHTVTVTSNWHLLETSRYVVLNPVRAGLVEHPGQWRWSSYGAMTGAARRPDFLAIGPLLAEFGRDVESARAGYASFVAEGLLARR